MNYKLHDNGWTVIIDDFDLRELTQADVNTLARLLLTNTLIVIKNQDHLTVRDEIRLGEMFGELENFRNINPAAGDAVEDIIVQGSEGKMNRVTGEKNDKGEIGLFGSPDELVWHCNLLKLGDRKTMVYLRAIHGSVGSRTSFNNNILAYQLLSPEMKEKVDPLKVLCGWTSKKTFMPYDINFGTSKYFAMPESDCIFPDYAPNLVQTNELGVTGLFFSYTQMVQFEGWSQEDSEALMVELAKHTLQEQFIYHHDWQDGDVLLANQWFGVHKRDAFPDIDKRLLHRMTFDLSKAELNT